MHATLAPMLLAAGLGRDPGQCPLGVAVQHLHHDFQEPAARTLSLLRFRRCARASACSGAWSGAHRGPALQRAPSRGPCAARFSLTRNNDRCDELDFALLVRGDGTRFHLDGLRRFEGPLSPSIRWYDQLKRLDFLPRRTGSWSGASIWCSSYEGRWYPPTKSNRPPDHRGARLPDPLAPMRAALPAPVPPSTPSSRQGCCGSQPGFDVQRLRWDVVNLFTTVHGSRSSGDGVFSDRLRPALIDRLDELPGGHDLPGHAAVLGLLGPSMCTSPRLRLAGVDRRPGRRAQICLSRADVRGVCSVDLTTVQAETVRRTS
jgi:hypothetical protein